MAQPPKDAIPKLSNDTGIEPDAQFQEKAAKFRHS